MGGYLCHRDSCQHCQNSHSKPDGGCVDCVCMKYTPGSHYSEFC